MSTRREFIQRIGALGGWAMGAGLAGATARGRAFAADRPPEPFQLPKLPYPYDALEPHIDARTMEIHHTRHHQAYVAGLNKAVENHPDLREKGLGELLGHIDHVPEPIRQAVINFGGGHANHSLFWEIMGPGKGGPPTGPIAAAITKAFGGFDPFKTLFSQTAEKHFGSGWAWLVRDREGALHVYATPNQDSPLMKGHVPVLGLDVWEHAYYLKYQNRRAEYIRAWWNVVNWDAVNGKYQQAART